MTMKKLMVLALAFALMAGAGCRKMSHDERPAPVAQEQPRPQAAPQPQPQPEQQPVAEIVYGPDGTIHPDDETPDDWRLPAGESFVTMIPTNDSRNYVVAKAGIINKVYRMHEDGHLGLAYTFKDGAPK